MKANKHPALTLFSEMFAKAAANPSPELPTHYVPRNVFHSECKRRGIDSPENFIAGLKWEEEIGLRKHVRKVLAAHYKATGTSPTAMERGAMRLERQLKNQRS